MDNSRDNNIYIFRAIGKFLYNKRIINEKEEPRTLNFKEMVQLEKKTGSKPRFYDNHQKIIDSTLLEPQ